MEIRSKTAVVLAALGTLTAGASVAAATAWAGPPLHVEVGEARCLRTADLPIVGKFLKDAVGQEDLTTVRLTFRSATNARQAVSYSVAVDGNVRASGSVSGGGVSINSVTVANNGSSRLIVTTGPTVVIDRTITGHC
ncbi:hypothetical protein [Saccharopolyspora sp. ASAGF58]|uniref:hypothetical protein n=1 Tax=Saccharopolyspora sp. ASAGF58 TaxID=2719023 RepID=UPI001440247C|nr:hypothetical protein [Saccharopolyspora sp. ASAGF58]QIZ34684.1 hypothetical protein FDZ84_08025 [Saccharopolyspora sp. ASAGF58]